MIDNLRHLRVERDERGIATVTFDMQGMPVNVFNEAVVAELKAVVDHLEREPPRLVVFRSAKRSGFLAGADVRYIRRINSEFEARMVLDAGQQLFERIEHLPCPTVAVIHGPCLGGGLEFALACRHRIARNDIQTKIGLPETTLGLIPGWGGTQRLPQIVGLRQALRMILEGMMLSAANAAYVSLIDRAISAERFEAEVQQFIDERLTGKPLPRRSRGVGGSLVEGTRLGRSVVFAAARKRIGKRGRDYPALPAALRAIEAGFRGDRQSGLAIERDAFAEILFTPAARNLLDLFLEREQARKHSTWIHDDHALPAPVRKAAVVGAGTMGAGIAQLLALHGIPVVLKDQTLEFVKQGMKRIESLTSAAASKGLLSRDEAAQLIGKVTPADDWGRFADVDLAIEAVVEREDVKRDVFRQLAERMPWNAILVSNTSALSITRLQSSIGNANRVAGLHFFNPVHRMQLVEVVRSRSTDDPTVATLVELVRRLGKVPVVVADSPGFVVNRILLPYLDEAVRMVCAGVPTVTIDREAVHFGMPVGPLELIDQIGVDVAADVAGSLARARTDPGPTPDRLAVMVKAKALGKKSGQGFYEYRGSRRGKPVRWPDAPSPAVISEGKANAASDTPIQQRLIYLMINEAAKCLEESVVGEAWMIDLAMVLGTGYAPFRGGPLHTADSLGIGHIVCNLECLAQENGARFEPCELLRTMASEGRTFFAAEAQPTKADVLEHEEIHR